MVCRLGWIKDYAGNRHDFAIRHTQSFRLRTFGFRTSSLETGRLLGTTTGQAGGYFHVFDDIKTYTVTGRAIVYFVSQYGNFFELT